MSATERFEQAHDADDPVERLLRVAARRAIERVLPERAHVSAGITLIAPPDHVVFASTDQRARELNRLQFTTGGGAGPRCARTGASAEHHGTDTARLVERERQLGVTSRLAVPIRPPDGDGSVEVLTMWASGVDLDESTVGQIATDIAALVEQARRLVAHLRSAARAEAELRRPDPVPTALGILMERHDCDLETARAELESMADEATSIRAAARRLLDGVAQDSTTPIER